MTNRKVLLVGDHVNFFDANVPLLRGRGYDVRTVDFSRNYEFPSGKFDVVVVSDLDGWGLPVLSAVHSERKILYSTFSPQARLAKKLGCEVYKRSEPITKFLSGVK